MKTLLEFDHKKATQAINYIAKKEGGKIGKLKLIKLIYFADRYHLRRFGRPILNDTYYAMPYGPVGSSVKDIAEFSEFLSDSERQYASEYLAINKNDSKVFSMGSLDLKVFSKSELEALEFAYSKFGSKSAFELTEISHRYPEWSKYKVALESKETTRESMSYSDFFENPENLTDDQFNIPERIIGASKEAFSDNFQIAQCWA